MKTIYTTILLLFFYVEKLPSQDCIEGISIKSAFNEDELFNFKNTQDEYHYNLLFDKPEYTRTYLKIYDNDTIYFEDTFNAFVSPLDTILDTIVFLTFPQSKVIDYNNTNCVNLQIIRESRDPDFPDSCKHYDVYLPIYYDAASLKNYDGPKGYPYLTRYKKYNTLVIFYDRTRQVMLNRLPIKKTLQPSKS